ncbi:TIGR02281 family clan AA aspartic protease [Sphingosinicella sp. LHD-64]|uniref:retropepsin-like aspartic protease family protein n=1 Tax=Sphingosinicella sp. LHD-64 TaxID=3072139 RepID=UPI00280DBAC8|nr:TIGR02281 family clan AA aspartic protease [Sphingosinicella sp. LHD-64]MDQ8754794.1 TIGR02281 family clan AA aspartic protease [Sphingosinicella sp. LHD-64]
MNEGDQAIHVIYLIGVLVMVVSALMVRRIPLASGLKMFVGWVLIFGAAFVIFTMKDEFLALGNRVLLEARGGTVEEVAGRPGEVRVRQASDGHFWVDAEVNGRQVRFLIDSGATTTSLSRAAAERAGIVVSGGFPAMVRTANGIVEVDRGRAETLRIGPIERRDVAVHISDAFGDLNVIGMNFLSSLSGWSVEGRTLVMRSGNTAAPAAVADATAPPIDEPDSQGEKPATR